MSSASPHARHSDSSLEHCYTNIFAITDCNGIHYKKFTPKVESESGSILDDPVIKSFVLCQQNNIMSAWVRSKRESLDRSNPCSWTAFSKELWVFWYGSSDLPNADTCILPELREVDRGNWRQGLSYETRTVLFRALHNVVERCLLTKGFVRLGKWFVQPYKHNCNQDYAQYSVSFSFFLHGESTVCASLDLRRHPLVRRISPRHVAYCTRRQKSIPVILAPYGISGELVGASRDQEEKLAGEWEAWSNFYPLKAVFDLAGKESDTLGLPNFSTSVAQGSRAHGQQRFNLSHDKRPLFNGSSGKTSACPPSFVDVIVGTFRLRYPSCFVLIPEKRQTPIDTSRTTPHQSNPRAVNTPYQVPDLPIGYSLRSSLHSPSFTEVPKYSFWHPSESKTVNDLGHSMKDSSPLSDRYSDISFDVRRIRKADRTLYLSNLDGITPPKLPRSMLGHPKEPENEEVGNSLIVGSSFVRCDNASFKSTCHCSTGSQQSNTHELFHHANCGIRRALRKLLNDNDRSAGGSQLPITSSSSFTVPHDPLMPTLSPQQPTSLSASTSTYAACTKVAVDSTPVCKLEPSTSVVTSKMFASRPIPEFEATPQKHAVALPSGLVAVDRVSIPANDSHPGRQPILVSLVKNMHENSWLMEKSSLEGTSDDMRKPELRLAPADSMELDESRLAYSPRRGYVEYASNEEGQAKRRRGFLPKHPTDCFPCQDESIWQSESDIPVSSTTAEHIPITPETPGEYCDFEPSDDPLGATTALDHVGSSQTSLPGSSTTLLTRTLGFPPHLGMSLASSTGSGPIGPKELALMLPTPPSHDAPQPSPVDGVTAAASVAIPLANAVSRPNHSTFSSTADSSPGQGTSVELIDASTSSCAHLGIPHATLLHLAKQPCVQDFNFMNLNPYQDWLFLQPCAAYYGVANTYQLPHSNTLPLSKSLPHVDWAFDHRVQRSRIPLVPPHSDLAAVHSRPAHPSPCASVQRTTRLDTTSPRQSVSPLCQRDTSFDKHPLAYVSGYGGDSVLSTSGLSHMFPVTSEFACDETTERLNNLTESNSILLNVLLSDSMLNLFKDHNFDSCNICECTSSVLGSEVDLYLSNCAPFLSHSANKTQRSSLGSVTTSGGPSFGAPDLVGSSAFIGSNDCKCGFSAVINQRYVVHGNLFFEDEVEVTNLRVCMDLKTAHPPKSYSVPPIYRRPSLCWSTSPASMHGRLALLKQLAQCSYNEFFVRQLTGYLTRTDFASPLKHIKENFFEYDDACTLVSAFLSEASVSRVTTGPQPVEHHPFIHPSYMMKAHSIIPENHNDQIRLLSTLRPWLQEAISSTRLLESNYTVDGPLSWKAFHQLAGRGADETCEPQPVPLLRIGSAAKEHMLISPFALRDWDRLSLSPLSAQKQIAYAVVVPGCLQNTLPPNRTGFTETRGPKAMIGEDKFLEQSLARFFYELSMTYENCRLGQHLPYYQPEVNQPQSGFIFVDSFDEHASELKQGSMLRNLTEVLIAGLQNSSSEKFTTLLRSYLAAARTTVLTAFRERGVSIAHRSSKGSSSVEAVNFFPRFPPYGEGVNKMEQSKDLCKTGKILGHSSKNPQNGQGPLTASLDTSAWSSSGDVYLIVYLLNPFSQLCDSNPELARVITQGFLECGHQIVTALPTPWQPRVNVQLVPIEQVMSDYVWRLRSISLAVYTSINRYIEPSLINANRTLTGLGPAAEKETISNEKEAYHKRAVHAPAYILGGSRCSSQWDMPPSDPFYRSSVLFVAYCLSQDQQWLLASVTDDYGSLLDQTLINICVPSVYFNELEKRRTQSASAAEDSDVPHFISPRRLGLARLWDYIINVISRTSNPWRLVIGRIGRLGQGELKGWNSLLGRKSLQDVNKFFREHCSVCNSSASVPSQTVIMGSKATLNLINGSGGANSCTHELPSLISACLTSLEPQSTFRVYPGLGLSSDDGGSGGGGAGTSGSAIVGNVTGSASAIGGSLNGAAASPFTTRTMILAGNETVTDVPSVTHILVFPTSTSASGLSEHDPTELDCVMSGMNFLDWLSSGNNELGDLDGPGNAAAAMFDEFDNPAGLEFGLAGLSPTAASGAVNDHCGPVGHATSALSDVNETVLAHPDYHSMHDHRDHDRVSDVVGLHGMQATGLVPGNFGAAKSFRNGVGGPTALNLLSTMPHGLSDRPDEVTNLMQQPLAMGYYISTAPTGPLPAWFWAACPHSSLQFPVCLKSALHIQTSLVGLDDAAAAAPPPVGSTGSSSTDRPNHLLDSTSTCDVLRYVLEAYNALSWLTINPTTNDRRSCLPIHVLVLCQLYQSVEAFT